jgi:hypothetical protein
VPARLGRADEHDGVAAVKPGAPENRAALLADRGSAAPAAPGGQTRVAGEDQRVDHLGGLAVLRREPRRPAQ